MEELNLKHNPQINDTAVQYLSKLENLYALDLEGTSVTSEGGRTIADAIDLLDFEDLGIQKNATRRCRNSTR